jgi:NDP-sugar pyrophosphorylase family protein
MDAVVMAAGEGRRLRPVTDVWPKAVLPIDGRPVVATLLRELAAASCARVFMVTGHLAEHVERLVGDGSGFGVEIAFVRQPRPDGSADTLRRSLAAGAAPPLLVAVGDTVFRRGDVAQFAAAAMDAPAGALAVRREPPPGPGRAAVRVEDGRVTRVPDTDAASPFAAASLWAYTERLAPFLDGLTGPPYELAEAYQRAIDAGEPVRAVEIGRTRDLTDPLDLVEENFPYLEQR